MEELLGVKEPQLVSPDVQAEQPSICTVFKEQRWPQILRQDDTEHFKSVIEFSLRLKLVWDCMKYCWLISVYIFILVSLLKNIYPSCIIGIIIC